MSQKSTRQKNLTKKKRLGVEGWPNRLFLFSLVLVLLIFALSSFRLLIVLITRRPIQISSSTVLPEKILYQPSSPASHLILAKQLLELNNPQRALEETLIALSLGATKEEVNEVQQLAQFRARLKRDLHRDQERWRQLTATRSGYRDGWYQLAVISWMLAEDGAAKVALEQALKIDPNFEPALKLRRLI